MPVHRGQDSIGAYFQWGQHGKRYYYIAGNARSRQIARNKATKQAIAIYSSGYKGK